MNKPRHPPNRGAARRHRAMTWLDSRVDFERVPSGVQPGMSFGLARMRRLLAAVGNPQRRYAVVHVAGTKGKGSTVAMIAAILEESGYRVGRYMSPHVHRLAERISIDGRTIADADLVAALEPVIPAVAALDRSAARRGGRGPSWFEILTAAAFGHFARRQVDIAVVETGLGGRLDATNVVRPLVSVITNISLDHMALLGKTIGKIATEKAGIIKRGRPVVSGALHPDARRVIAETAGRRRAPLLQLGRDFQAAALPPTAPADILAGGIVELVPPGRRGAGTIRRHRVAMAGPHQAINAAVAAVTAERLSGLGYPVPPEAIDRGLGRARLPARIEAVPGNPLVVIDAAHNVASMQSLVETLAPALVPPRRRTLLFAASGDKQVEEMLVLAAGRFDHVVLTRFETNPRAAPIERLATACRAARLPRPHVADSPAAGLRLARSLAGRSGIVVVAGSFFLATEVHAAL